MLCCLYIMICCACANFLFDNAKNRTCFYNLLFSVEQSGVDIDNSCHVDFKTTLQKKKESLSSVHLRLLNPPVIGRASSELLYAQ